MKKKIAVVIVSLAAALFAMPAVAQPGMGGGMGPGMPGGGGQGMRGAADCSKAPYPEQCRARQAAHQKMLEACRDTTGPQRRACLHEQAQQFDCGQSANPPHCEARKQAYAACSAQAGPQFRRCVQEKLPPADCSRMPGPQCAARQQAYAACKEQTGEDFKLCTRQQRAHEQCKDLLGPAHQQCLRDILAPAR